MFDNFGHFFKKVVKQEPVEEIESKSAAKERLQLVLMQDRANVSADFLELMKKEIIDVVKKYIVVDEDAIDVRLTTQVNEDGTNGEPTLYANIPIVNIRNELKAERITDQINFAELIEEQSKQEVEKLEKQEDSKPVGNQLFNMSDTQRTVIIDDDMLNKVNKELVTTKEREAKLEEKESKREEREAKREERKEERQAKKELKKQETAKVAVVKEQAELKVEKTEEPKSEKEETKKAEAPKDKKSVESTSKKATDDLRQSIEDEIAELDDLEKELFKAANELEDDEDEDFVTFDELYAKAQEEDAANAKNKSKK